jgi:hypothetical protein
MSVYRRTRHFVDYFDRAQALTTTPGHNGWTISDTSSSGTPTYLCITEDGGAMKLTLASTSEAEHVCMYMNDVLPWDLADLHRVHIVAKVADIDSVTTLSMGVGNAQADDEDDVTVSAWFKMEGSASTSNLVVETDDATNETTDVATGETLAGTYKHLIIDFQNGLSDIRFFVDGSRVADSTTFTMADVASGQNVQPYIQLSKASGTGTPSVTIAAIEAQFNVGYGA